MVLTFQALHNTEDLIDMVMGGVNNKVLKASLKSITEKYQAMFSGKAFSKALEI